ncbi:hypothetical protein TL16_g00220 [Triparma laevis f. inornata]|uniref:Uncharacterized protein n=1 Tax=Triparma laevis f. inornata TaxID=1714386 RepID=A0A9W6ZDH2_9STRA|nr:hypothetical protein TL16_g00220 [Triparma laevis f. inornata]
MLTIIAAVTLLAIFATGSLTVPEAPASASLTVLSGSEIEMSFISPPSDGGSAVSAYTVEWDSDNGTPEVQVITSSVYLGPNEIQTITTSADDVNEVQHIETRATAVREIQTVTVSPRTGETSMDASWTFSLSLDTVGALQYSGEISSTAAAAGSRSAVEEIMGFMSNVDSGTTVTRTSPNADGGYTWSIQFAESMGNVPELTVYSSDVPIVVATLTEGNVLSGTFRVTFDGETTGDIPYDASEGEFQTAMQSLSNVGLIDVTRTAGTQVHQFGYKWEFTFTADDNAGNLPEITSNLAGLTQSNPSGTITLPVGTTTQGNELTGTFDLDYTRATWNPAVTGVNAGAASITGIKVDSTEAEMKAKLEDGTIIPADSLSVSRSARDFEGGYTWTVTFLEVRTKKTHPNLNPPLTPPPPKPTPTGLP